MNERICVSFDAALNFALQESYRQEMAALPSDDELKRLYPDTSNWDEKILPAALKELNATSRKKHKRRPVRILKRVFIGILLIISLFACTMMASAEVRNAVVNTFFEWTDGGKGLAIRFQMAGTPLTALPEGYREYYIPEGFEFDAASSMNNNVSFSHVYRNPEGLYIAIDVNIAENASVTIVDTEYSTYNQITFNDTTYYLGEFTDPSGYSGSRILWLKDGIEHSINAYIDLSELLKIVESIY